MVFIRQQPRLVTQSDAHKGGNAAGRSQARRQKEDMEMVHFDTYDEAMENCRGDEVVVEVDGGWAVMSVTDYRVWVMQD